MYNDNNTQNTVYQNTQTNNNKTNNQNTDCYYKNKNTITIKGCNHKCPCGLWINCPYYNWWKKKKYYWLERWRNCQRYREAHEKLDSSMDFHINSIANG